MDESKNKPAVLVFSSFYHPKASGAEIAIEEIIKRLKDKFDFYVITHRENMDRPTVEDYGGARIHRIGGGTRFDRMFIFPFLAAFEGWMFLRSLKGRKVIMWGVMVSYASIGAFLIKLFKKEVPFLLTIQEGDFEWRFRLRNMGLSAIWWRIIIRKTNYITTISKYLAGEVFDMGYKGPLEILPNGVDERLLEVQRKPSGKVIFTASRLAYKNGLDILINAIAKIKDKHLKVMIAGDGKEEKNLKALAESLGVEDKIEFLGRQPYERLIDFYSISDIFVRPSRSEGLGSAFLEAMAAGLVVVGTQVGGIRDFLFDGKTGIFANTNDPDDLVRAIKIALNLTDHQRDTITKSARDLIRERFLWKDIAHRAEKIFLKLI